MNPKIDLTGQVFNHLTFVKFSHRTIPTHNYWWVKCSCGVEKIVQAADVKSGRVVSCGHVIKEKLKNGLNRTHGQSHSRTHAIWCGMLVRCYAKSNRDYPRWGGQGVTVYEPWRLNYSAFLAYVGDAPAGKSLDRFPNPYGNYEPGNVRWATRKEQANNRRNSSIPIKFIVDFQENLHMSNRQLAIRYGTYHAAIARWRKKLVNVVVAP